MGLKSLGMKRNYLYIVLYIIKENLMERGSDIGAEDSEGIHDAWLKRSIHKLDI